MSCLARTRQLRYNCALNTSASSPTPMATQASTCFPHIQILPVGEDPSTAREVAGHQLSFGSFPGGGEWEQDSCLLSLTPDPPQSPITPGLPNSPEPNLGSVLIPGRVLCRLGLTPRAMGSRGGARGLKNETPQDTPALCVSAISLPVQRLSHLQLCRGLRDPTESQLHLSI